MEMTESTPLDIAHAAMEAAPQDDAARLAFFERLADAELFLLLSAEPTGDAISPEVFELESGTVVLAFDRDTRLTGFTGRAAPYAALSGRALVALLAPQGLGLGLNLDVAPSAMLLPAEAVGWLHDTLQNRPQEVEAGVSDVTPPGGLPERLITALDAKLATATGLADAAYLAGVVYDGGGRGHLLAFVDAMPGAEDALAHAAGEALTFSGVEQGAMDIGFFRASDLVCAALARVGLRFDLPKAPDPEAAAPRAAPGSDPDRPPRLR